MYAPWLNFLERALGGSRELVEFGESEAAERADGIEPHAPLKSVLGDANGGVALLEGVLYSVESELSVLGDANGGVALLEGVLYSVESELQAREVEMDGEIGIPFFQISLVNPSLPQANLTEMWNRGDAGEFDIAVYIQPLEALKLLKFFG